MCTCGKVQLVCMPNCHILICCFLNVSWGMPADRIRKMHYDRLLQEFMEAMRRHQEAKVHVF